ncbi:unnamed protein product, partial [Mycena citricolor]
FCALLCGGVTTAVNNGAEALTIQIQIFIQLTMIAIITQTPAFQNCGDAQCSCASCTCEAGNCECASEECKC